MKETSKEQSSLAISLMKMLFSIDVDEDNIMAIENEELKNET